MSVYLDVEECPEILKGYCGSALVMEQDTDDFHGVWCHLIFDPCNPPDLPMRLDLSLPAVFDHAGRTLARMLGWTLKLGQPPPLVDRCADGSGWLFTHPDRMRQHVLRYEELGRVPKNHAEALGEALTRLSEEARDAR